MGGKMSRDKGSRNERILRDELRAAGYVAERVPLSGASAGFKGDLIASKNGLTHTLELKTRAPGSYGSLYRLTDAIRRLPKDLEGYGVGLNVQGCLIGTYDSMDEALDNRRTFYTFLQQPELFKTYIRAINKLYGMRKLLGSADVLVFREDRRGHVYCRYWEKGSENG